jgi:hypothetical protein
MIVTVTVIVTSNTTSKGEGNREIEISKGIEKRIEMRTIN